MFEECYRVDPEKPNKKEPPVASHKDPKDPKQTIYVPEIGTVATDKADGDHYIYNSGTNTIVDTILCLDGTEVIGACVADELTREDYVNMNAHQTIYVIPPELIGGGQMIFRDNLVPMLKGKHVLILAASVTTGKTAQAAIEAVKYYKGLVVGVSAIFATVDKCGGYPVTSIFDPNDLGDYNSYNSHNCPICEKGERIEAIVNSYGYSAL